MFYEEKRFVPMWLIERRVLEIVDYRDCGWWTFWYLKRRDNSRVR